MDPWRPANEHNQFRTPVWYVGNILLVGEVANASIRRTFDNPNSMAGPRFRIESLGDSPLPGARTTPTSEIKSSVDKVVGPLPTHVTSVVG